MEFQEVNQTMNDKIEENILKEDFLKEFSINDIEILFKNCIEELYKRMSKTNKEYYGESLKDLTFQVMLRKLIKFGHYEELIKIIKKKQEILEKIDSLISNHNL